MTLHDRIDADLTAAMKARDRATLDALRLLRSALTNRAVSDGTRPDTRLVDDVVMAVLATEVKRRREAAAAFRDGGREESAAKEDAEAEVYAGYLPAQLGDDEVAALVDAAIARLGASGPRDAGQLIKEVLAVAGGTVDGGRVATTVRDRLTGA